jgi:hypothetical protein
VISASQHIFSGDEIKEGNIGGTGSKRRGLHRMLVEELDIKGALGKPRCSYEDNIKTDHQEKFQILDWPDLAKVRDK